MAIFTKEILFVTILSIVGVLAQNPLTLGRTTDSTNKASVTETTTGQSDKNEIKVDLAIGETTLTEAIKILKANNSGFVRLYPAGRLEELLKNVTSESFRVEAGATIFPIPSTENTTTSIPETTTTYIPETTTTYIPETTTTSIPETTTTSIPESTTTSIAESTTTSKAESTTTSKAESTTTSKAESTTTSIAESTTTSIPQTTSPQPTTTTPVPKPTPTPHHGLTRGEIAALVIFIIILFGVASGALIFYIRRRRHAADDSYTQLVR